MMSWHSMMWTIFADLFLGKLPPVTILPLEQSSLIRQHDISLVDGCAAWKVDGTAEFASMVTALLACPGYHNTFVPCLCLLADNIVYFDCHTIGFTRVLFGMKVVQTANRKNLFGCQGWLFLQSMFYGQIVPCCFSRLPEPSWWFVCRTCLPFVQALVQRAWPAHRSDFRWRQCHDHASEICSCPKVIKQAGAELDIIHQQENADEVCRDAQLAPIITHLPQIFVAEFWVAYKYIVFVINASWDLVCFFHFP